MSTIDRLAEEGAFRSPDAIKIDIEGAELAALRGASGLLTGAHPPAVFLELHNDILRDGGRDPEDVVDWLLERGFTCDDVLTGPIRPITFLRPVSRLVARPKAN